MPRRLTLHHGHERLSNTQHLEPSLTFGSNSFGSDQGAPNMQGGQNDTGGPMPGAPHPGQSMDAEDYRRLSRAFFCNRTYEGCDPLDAYRTYVRGWARSSPELLREHCGHLLTIAANPVMLNVALEQIKEKHGPTVFARTALGDFDDYPAVRWGELREISEFITAGGFQRGKYRRVRILKGSGDDYRVIEVPPVDGG
jgi:hypothetical protein